MSAGLRRHTIKSVGLTRLVFDGLSTSYIAHSRMCRGSRLDVVFQWSPNVRRMAGRFQACSSVAAANWNWPPGLVTPCVQGPKYTGLPSYSQNPMSKHVRTRREKTPSGLLPPRWKMIGINWANFNQWRTVAKIHPLWNTVSGLLPPTSMMVETDPTSGRICPRHWESIVKRLDYRPTLYWYLTHRNILKSALASFDNVRQ